MRPESGRIPATKGAVANLARLVRRWRAVAALLIGVAAMTATACDPMARDAARVEGVTIPVATVEKLAKDSAFLEGAQIGSATEKDATAIDGDTARGIVRFLVITEVLREEAKAAGGNLNASQQAPDTSGLSKTGAKAAEQRTAAAQAMQTAAGTDAGKKRFEAVAARYVAAHPGQFGKVCVVGVVVPESDAAAVRKEVAKGTDPATIAAGGQAQAVGEKDNPLCIENGAVSGDIMAELLELREGRQGEVAIPMQAGPGVLFVTVDSTDRYDSEAALASLNTAFSGENGLDTWARVAFDRADVWVDPRYGDWDSAALDITQPAAPLPQVGGPVATPAAPAGS